MRILITGGAGYIGSHTAIEFLNQGHEVVIIDNLSNSKREVLDKISQITGKKVGFYEMDLLDAQGLKKVFDENEIDGVIHFAGLKAVGESVEQPLRYYHNNLTSTLELCKAMGNKGVKNLVFSSSATVYDTNNTLPLKEDMSLGANCPYGRTKVFIEEILQDLAYADDQWNISLLRYFNPGGAHESGEIGEDPHGIPNNLLPFISQVAVGKLEKLRVFGGDYDTPDGTCIRDYIHVIDLAKGHLKAMEYLLNHKGIQAINLGTGKGNSVLEMVAAFGKAVGREIPYEIVDRRAGDIPACWADVSKAKELLGWEAEKTIDDICRDSWRWQSKNPNGL